CSSPVSRRRRALRNRPAIASCPYDEPEDRGMTWKQRKYLAASLKLLEHDLFRKPVSTFRDHARASRIEPHPGAVDERLPLGAFRVDDRRKSRGIAADRLGAGVADARLQLGELADFHQRGGEPIADFGRQPGRTEEAHPARQLEIGKSRLD